MEKSNTVSAAPSPDPLDRLEAALGHAFARRDLLVRAVTHPSFAVEQSRPTADNQRLEFLGDAVLQLVASDLLFADHPEASEGELTRLRSAATKEGALVRFARRLDVGAALRLGVGEDRGGGRDRASNLGDAFEALLGALYLDAGLEPVRRLFGRLAQDLLSDTDAVLARENPKGALQEWTQAHLQKLPTYEVVSVTGPEHMPCFEVRLLLEDEELARAAAGSRRQAEREAAVSALARLRERESND